MRRIGLLLVLFGCEGSTVGSTGDMDASVDVPDVPPESKRTKQGLCALWTFNETSGAYAFDTSDNIPVQLEIFDAPANGVYPATFSGGDVIANMPGRLASQENTRLGDCANTGGVTLEAWVQPANAIQGTLAEPAHVAGLSGNVGLRNIALFQSGNKWSAVVRTSASNVDGAPSIIPGGSAGTVSTTEMTHIAIVADATRRTLYVNNKPLMTGTPSAPSGWDTSYAMVLFDEWQHGRQWLGRFALLALYSRALSPEEIQIHWVLGPKADAE